MTDNVAALHRIRCALCGFGTNEIALFYGHRCHPSKRAQGAAGSPATPTTDRPRTPLLRLVGTQPAGDPNA